MNKLIPTVGIFCFLLFAYLFYNEYWVIDAGKVVLLIVAFFVGYSVWHYYWDDGNTPKWWQE